MKSYLKRLNSNLKVDGRTINSSKEINGACTLKSTLSILSSIALVKKVIAAC